MLFESKGERREPRISNYVSVLFHLDSDPSYRIISGVTRDMSDSGICMYTMYSLTEGQVIVFESKPAKPNQRATVIWVKKYGNFYKVGLEFETAPSSMSLQCHQGTSHL
jgi:hypothetical protein